MPSVTYLEQTTFFINCEGRGQVAVPVQSVGKNSFTSDKVLYTLYRYIFKQLPLFKFIDSTVIRALLYTRAPCFTRTNDVANMRFFRDIVHTRPHLDLVHYIYYQSITVQTRDIEYYKLDLISRISSAIAKNVFATEYDRNFSSYI